MMESTARLLFGSILVLSLGACATSPAPSDVVSYFVVPCTTPGSFAAQPTVAAIEGQSATPSPTDAAATIPLATAVTGTLPAATCLVAATTTRQRALSSYRPYYDDNGYGYNYGLGYGLGYHLAPGFGFGYGSGFYGHPFNGSIGFFGGHYGGHLGGRGMRR